MTCITSAMLPALLGRPVAYQAVFTKLPGVGVQGAIFLSQALFLSGTPTAQARDGWFWKEQQGPQDSWESETGMTAKQQLTARRQLTEIGVLEEARKGVPAKTWYRVNCDRLAALLAEALGREEGVETAASPHGCPVSPNGRNSNPPTGESRISQPERTESPDGSFLTETTTEITPSLSDAGDVFERAARQCDDGTPPPARSHRAPMTLDWQPDPEQLAMACQRASLPTDTWPAPHQLAKFTAHHADSGRAHGAAAWHAKLADWLRNDLRAAQNTAGGTRHAQPAAAHRGLDRQDERQRIAEQLANPGDTSWADGWWPEDDTDAAPGPDAGAGQPGVHPAGGDLPEDLGECVPECGPAEPGAPGAGPGAGAVAGAARPGGGGAGHERAEARGEYLAADDPGLGELAGADRGGLRHAGSW